MMRIKYIIGLLSLFILLGLADSFLLYRYQKRIEKERLSGQILEEISRVKKTSAKILGIIPNPFALHSASDTVELTDVRVNNLQAFFRKHNSELYHHADLFVTEADKRGYDYRLLPAIAMQESNLCKKSRKDSHNCWGWGIYGSKVTKFDSYEEAIKTVSKGIKEQYLDKGLVTASQVMSRYTPSSTTWADGVNHFMRALE